MSYDETLEETPTHRLRLVLDEYPSEPEFEAGFPVLRIDAGRWGYEVDHTGYGDDLLDGAFALKNFIRSHGVREGIEAFERWLRIFHDGAIIENHTASRDYVYIAYSCRELWEKWGTDYQHRAEGPEMSEWIAYVEGDVWGYVIEERAYSRTTITSLNGIEDVGPEVEVWVEVDSLWGFYGREYAEEAAREAFADMVQVEREEV